MLICVFVFFEWRSGYIIVVLVYSVLVYLAIV